MKANLTFLICLVISSLQIGCSAKTKDRSIHTPQVEASDVGDGGFLSGEPCGPPCFFEITPGITTSDQAISQLQVWGLYQDCQEYDGRKQGGVRGIACQTVIVGIQNDLDIVDSVGFRPTQTITVEQVIAKYGEPSAVLTTTHGNSVDVVTTSMILYYDRLNAELVLAEQYSSGFDLRPTTLVAIVGYSDENSYNLSRRYFQDWTGYSIYKQWNP